MSFVSEQDKPRESQSPNVPDNAASSRLPSSIAQAPLAASPPRMDEGPPPSYDEALRSTTFLAPVGGSRPPREQADLIGESQLQLYNLDAQTLAQFRPPPYYTINLETDAVSSTSSSAAKMPRPNAILSFCRCVGFGLLLLSVIFYLGIRIFASVARPPGGRF